MEYEDAMNEDQLLRKLIHQLAQIGPKMVGRSIKKLDLARSVGHTLICYTIIIAFEVHIFSHLIPNTILPTFFKKIFSLNLNWTVTVCRKFGWNRTENASQCNLIEPSLTPREPRTFFKCHHGGRTGLGSTLNGRYVSQSTTVRPSVCPSVRLRSDLWPSLDPRLHLMTKMPIRCLEAKFDSRQFLSILNNDDSILLTY